MPKENFSWIGLIIFILIFGYALLHNQSPSIEDKYEKLQEEYSQLEDKYSELEDKYYEALDKEEMLSEKVWSFEDDNAVLWSYFEGENVITFSEAYDAYQRINTLWSY